MDKKEHITKAQDPIYISGIYNYCDRWCEWCLFTSRCLNYDISEEEFRDIKSIESHKKEFFEKLQNILQQTQEMLTEKAEEIGLSFTDCL